uniref:Endonuclease/exonuclease/phosphatase domain-containing protein n=1 Tax=Cyprinus carpio TaxID=7962 RepID=A0A8C1ZIR7_CYPCA
MASESEFKVLSWNIRGLKTRLNEKEALLAIFGKYDVVLLQETHIGEKDIRKITEAFGVAILINKPHTRLEAICEGGDYAWVHAGTGNQKYTFVSVYYHSGDDHLICDLMVKIFSSFLRSGSEAFKCRPVFGGDFNTTLDDQDVKNAHGPRRKRLIRFMSILQLSDVWKEMHKGESRSESERYTHSCSKPISRLDYFFMLNQDLKYKSILTINYLLTTCLLLYIYKR